MYLLILNLKSDSITEKSSGYSIGYSKQKAHRIKYRIGQWNREVTHFEFLVHFPGLHPAYEFCIY